MDDLRALWQAVILQAIFDAGIKQTSTQNIKLRKQAMKWLNGDSEGDVYYVCELAGIDYDKVKRYIRKITNVENTNSKSTRKVISFRC